MRFSSYKGALRLTVFFCLVLPVQAQGFAELPDQLFVPEPRPDRSIPATRSEALPPPVIIESHGRQVRVVGTPFLPRDDEAIDFSASTERSWWASAAEDMLALWFTPAEAQPAETASAEDELHLADIKPLSSEVAR